MRDPNEARQSMRMARTILGSCIGGLQQAGIELNHIREAVRWLNDSPEFWVIVEAEHSRIEEQARQAATTLFGGGIHKGGM